MTIRCPYCNIEFDAERPMTTDEALTEAMDQLERARKDRSNLEGRVATLQAQIRSLALHLDEIEMAATAMRRTAKVARRTARHDERRSGP